MRLLAVILLFLLPVALLYLGYTDPAQHFLAPSTHNSHHLDADGGDAGVQRALDEVRTAAFSLLPSLKTKAAVRIPSPTQQRNIPKSINGAGRRCAQPATSRCGRCE